jgi:MFS family permease
MIQQLISRTFGLNIQRQDDRNAWYLIIEIFWASFLSSAVSFNAAFSLRLGASNSDIGLLSSIPALLAIIVSFPAGRFLQNLQHRKPWLIGSLAIYRGSFIFVVLLPFLAGTGLPLGPISVWILVLIGIPAYFFNIGFTALFADVINEDRRAAVYSARQILFNAAVSIMIFLMGRWLKTAPFPLNYQAMFTFGIITSFISIYYLAKMNIKDHPKPEVTPPPASLLGEMKKIRTALVENAGFGQIVRNTFLQSFMLWMAAPLYILYFVKTLKADESWLGLNGTIVSVVTIFAYMIWRRWMGKLGEATTLKITIVLSSIYPLLVGLSPSLTIILGAGAISGFTNAGVNMAHFNTLLKVMPGHSRAEYTAYWTILMNSGAFIAPLIGVQVANWLGITPTLIVCGIISSLAALSFTIWPIRVPPPVINTLPEEA